MPSVRRAAVPPGPPDFLGLTGHPVRWQLLLELARSDRQVRELTAATGHGQSLTSYHLGRLRSSGLVRVRRSSADRRDVYYSLDLSAYRDRLAGVGSQLHPGLLLVPAQVSARPPRRVGGKAVRVLFLCTGNSSRSQMAEAMLRRLAGARVDVASAGSAPRPVHADAVRAMRDRGIDLSRHRSKSLDEFVGQRWDYVITLCDRVREVCPEFPGWPEATHWSMADPAAAEEGYPAFVRTAEELQSRIEFLVSAIARATDEKGSTNVRV